MLVRAAAHTTQQHVVETTLSRYQRPVWLGGLVFVSLDGIDTEEGTNQICTHLIKVAPRIRDFSAFAIRIRNDKTPEEALRNAVLGSIPLGWWVLACLFMGVYDVNGKDEYTTTNMHWLVDYPPVRLVLTEIEQNAPKQLTVQFEGTTHLQAVTHVLKQQAWQHNTVCMLFAADLTAQDAAAVTEFVDEVWKACKTKQNQGLQRHQACRRIQWYNRHTLSGCHAYNACAAPVLPIPTE